MIDGLTILMILGAVTTPILFVRPPHFRCDVCGWTCHSWADLEAHETAHATAGVR